MPAQPAVEADRDSARMRAFQLVHDIQTGVETAADELAALATQAERLGWGEVARACLFGEMVCAWINRDGDVGTATAKLVERCSADDDRVMLALALALRSDQGFSGAAAAAAEDRDADLARAAVLLEHAEGGAPERISAHTACGIAFGNRWQFELSDQQYSKALAIGATEAPGTLDFLLAPIMFNLAESQVSWASLLRQLGDHEGILARRTAGIEAAAAAGAYAMADTWRAELEALGLLLAAMAGDDSAPSARRLLGELAARATDEPRTAGLLTLAAALSDAAARRAGAAEATEAAIAAIDPDVHPHVYDLALHLAAEIEADSGAGAGLRYARRLLHERSTQRLASLGAMRSRIRAERMANERELLSRHALLDDLTGIGNRRALEQYLANLEQLGVDTITLVVVDVNAFKRVNDRYGHPAGDAVLIGLARVLEHSIRSSDLAVRMGGDEFAVVLADTRLDAGFLRTVDMLSRFDDWSFDEVSPDLTVALSAGVASGAPTELAHLLVEADAALYRAKAGEGHQVLRSRLARALVERFD